MKKVVKAALCKLRGHTGWTDVTPLRYALRGYVIEQCARCQALRRTR